MTDEEFKAAAITVADVICACSTDDRFHLYTEIGKELGKRGQNFQAKHFAIAVLRELGAVP
jgi:hypothetical protein